jgi:hypothetical protein
VTVRYLAVCDGCGQEKGLAKFDDWGVVKIREPNRVIESVRQYDFCSQACLEEWWNKVACAGLSRPTGDQERDRG